MHFLFAKRFHNEGPATENALSIYNKIIASYSPCVLILALPGFCPGTAFQTHPGGHVTTIKSVMSSMSYCIMLLGNAHGNRDDVTMAST